MVSADNFTYATIQRSVLDLAKNYGFTHCDTSAIECLTSAVYHYMKQVCKDTKISSELAGRSAACSSDVLLAVKNNRLDVETLNQYMIWNEPIKASTELPQYPVILPERPESPLSDTELKEREEKEIPKFAPSIRIKPKVKKLPEEPAKEEDEEENFDELTLAAMRICSSIKPITHAAKNVDDFDKLNFVLSESLPSFDHYRSKYEHEIDFLGSSLAAQEAAAATAAAKEQIRQEEEAQRQKILEQEKLQYQQPQYYQQPEEPMIEFEDARQQKMVEFSKQFIPEITKPEIPKEEPPRIQTPITSTLAEDLFVSPSPSPPPEIKPNYSQEPPPVKPIPDQIISQPLPPITVPPTPINDLNQNVDIKNVDKEKHKKKHKHHKEKRREKEKEKEKKKDEERQNEEEKKSKKDKHKKKEKKKDREREKDKEKDKGKNHLKPKEQPPPLLLPLQPPKLLPPTSIGSSKITTNAPQNVPEPVNKNPVVSKKPEKEQKKKERKEKVLQRPLKEPEILPMEKLKPPSFKLRFPPSESTKSAPSRPPAPIQPPPSVPSNIANISGSSSSSKGSLKDQNIQKSATGENRPRKKNKEKEKERDKDKEREKEKEKSLKRKHKEEPATVSIPNIKESNKNDGEKEHKIIKHEKDKKRDKEKKEKDRTNETPQEREERKRLKKEKKKREKEKRKRKLEPSTNDNIPGEPGQKKQKISEPLPPPPPLPENKPLKIKISLPIRPPPTPAPAPIFQAPTIPSQPFPSKIDAPIFTFKHPATQPLVKSSYQSLPPKLPPPTSASKTPSNSKPSSSKRSSISSKPTSSKPSSSSSRHHSSRKDRDETYRSSNTESSKKAPKIMSERQQLTKALKESMETANLVPSSSSRSDRHSYEQRIAKKKRLEKDKLMGEKKSKNGNLGLPSSTAPPPPSLPSQLPQPLVQLPSNEPPPKLEAAAPTAENPEQLKDEEDEKFSWCPNCGLRYVDGDNMVACERCQYWYHWSCVGLVSEPQEEQWYCERCTEVLKKEKISKK